MQDTETPTTKPQGRGKSSNSVLSADICLLYVVLRMQTCCSGVCRTYNLREGSLGGRLVHEVLARQVDVVARAHRLEQGPLMHLARVARHRRQEGLDDLQLHALIRPLADEALAATPPRQQGARRGPAKGKGGRGIPASAAR